MRCFLVFIYLQGLVVFLLIFKSWMVSLLYFLEDCFIAVKETLCVCVRERE